MPDHKQKLLDLLCENNSADTSTSLAALFRNDPDRFRKFSVQSEQMLYDFSRTSIDRSALSELLELAQNSELQSWRNRLFSGEPVNVSENCPAHHPLLRESQPESSKTGVEIGEQVSAQRRALLSLGMSLYNGKMPGYHYPIKDVIHLGMGGSILGPQLVVEALQAEAHSQVRVHFLSSADGWELNALMQELEAQHTLVIAASKSFATAEIKLNLDCLKDWLQSAGSAVNPYAQMLAITARVDRASQAGFLEQNTLEIPASVGGRFSLWSSMGLPIVIRYGQQAYQQLLAGAESMDRHFQTATAEKNLPVMAALVTIWQRNVRNYPAVAVVPYDSRLRKLPAWLQQLDMESAGKSVDCHGQPLSQPAAPVVFGGTGTDSQHAFFQALYQGMETVPVEFIGVLNFHPDGNGACKHSRFQLINLLAQADALAFADKLEPEIQAASNCAHTEFAGNRPGTVMLLDSLTPQSLGELLAFYEHRIYTLSAIWGNNPFDQFGVEYGKRLAVKLGSLFDQASTAETGSAQSLQQWVLARLKNS